MQTQDSNGFPTMGSDELHKNNFKINLILEHYFFKSYSEKKEVSEKLKKINEIFQKYFNKKNLKINKNSILVKLDLDIIKKSSK